MSTLEAIIKAKYIASGSQVEHLAGIVANGQQGGGTYLKVLIAHTLEALHGRKRVSKRAQRNAVDEMHTKLYEHVLKGVGPADLDQVERNRRATFARTAASDLRGFIASGGDVREVDLDTVTKQQLREYGKRVPAGTRIERALSKSVDAVVRAVQRIAKKNPAKARARLEAARDQLDSLLEQLEELQPEKKQAKRKRANRQPSARIVESRVARRGQHTPGRRTGVHQPEMRV